MSGGEEKVEEMRELDMEPCVINYNVAISAKGNGGKWEHALGFLEAEQRHM